MLYGCMSMHTLQSVHSTVLLCLFAAQNHIDSASFLLWTEISAQFYKNGAKTCLCADTQKFI